GSADMRLGWAAIAFLGGCSLGIQRVDSAWDGRSAPVCDDGVTPILGDAFISGAALSVGFREARKPQNSGNALVEGASAVVALGFAISAGAGGEAVLGCKSATDQWQLAVATVISQDQQSPTRSVAAASRSQLRGFFCTMSSSSSSSLCARNRAGCEQV